MSVQPALRAQVTALLLCCTVAPVCAAQDRPETPRRATPARRLPSDTRAPVDAAGGRAATVAPETADISFTASVTAREVRYQAVPKTRVRFTGNPARRTDSRTTRQNIPKNVQPGVTYRNVGLRVRVHSAFEEIERRDAKTGDERPREGEAKTAQPRERAQPSGGAPR